jgi:tetratricopeptide (TPR) repeat protein
MRRAVIHRAFLLLPLWSGLALAGEAEWHAHMLAGEAAHKRGDDHAAATSFDAALREAQDFGPQDRRLATTLSRVALNHQAHGRLAEAEKHYQRALVIREATGGPEHAEVGRILNSIAGLYYRQGRFAEAGPLQERAISIGEKAFGPDHLSVATGLSNLGQLRYRQRRYAEAESLYLRTLQILRSKSSVAAQTDATAVQLKLDELRRIRTSAVDVVVVDSQSKLNELIHQTTTPSADALQIERQAAKPPVREDPESVAATARIWQRAGFELAIQTAKQALERGETAEAERLCFFAVTQVGTRTVEILEEYAALLATLNREGARNAKQRAEILSVQRQRREPGSVYLGFEPAGELIAYARLLRELARTAEADAVVALADAEKRVNLMNFTRAQILHQGRDPRGICP